MWLGDRFFYQPRHKVYDVLETIRAERESVTFTTADGQQLHGLFLPAEDPRGTILHVHGNGGNITSHIRYVSWLPRSGWNVLCFDYRGYGRSRGHITRAGSVIDTHAALDYLLARNDVASDRIAMFGQSLGGAVAIVVAADREEVRGVAVDGAFDHYRGIATWTIQHHWFTRTFGFWFPRVMMSNNHNPIDYVARISPRPLFVMHGTADRVVPVEMAQRLYDAARAPKELWLVHGADHYDAIESMPDISRPKLVSFFDRCLDVQLSPARV